MNWRKDVIDYALDFETRRQMEEQLAWIGREPGNPRPYYHLAQFYRMEGRQEEALGLLLHAVELEAAFAEAHAALAEIYAVRGDNGAAWSHARAAERNGSAGAVEMLKKYGVRED